MILIPKDNIEPLDKNTHITTQTSYLAQERVEENLEKQVSYLPLHHILYSLLS